MKHWIALSTFILLGLASCSDDKPEQDLIRPTITWLNTLPDSLNGGNALELELGLADDEALSQLKIEIHDNFDNHTHRKGGVLPFAWDSIINLQGLSQVVNLSIPVPADIAAGNYDVLVQAIDQAGNEAAPEVKSIYLTNAIDSELPQIQNVVWTPAEVAGEITLSGANASLKLDATLSDNLALDGAELTVTRESDEKLVYDYDEEAPSSNYQFSHQFNFDAAWGAGAYHVVLKLKDVKGNSAEIEAEVQYIP
ncbi:MAG: DUF4625 domain-containing protein [Bacteroidetes bacterium]|nr:MAG: DUF4625 domain-containing protein [Bacteroidota bacterium]